MRQTNNAHTFLNSSYQAVFKHAYVSGLASSFVMLLASPYAYAAGSDFADNSTDGLQTSVEINGSNVTQNQLGYANTILISGTSSTSKDTFLTIASATDADTNVFFKDSLHVTNGELTISGSETYSAALSGALETNSPIAGSMVFNGSTLKVKHGSVEVDAAQFTNSIIELLGKVGSKNQDTQDLYINYSALRTGLYGEKDPNQVGATILDNVEINLGDYSVLDAMGEISFNSGSILIKAQKPATVDKSYGEIEAKALIKADTLSLSDGTQDVTVTVESGAGGAIYANEINLNKGNINIEEDARLQIAGKISLTDLENNAPDSGGFNSAKKYLSTNFASSTFNISSGTITNSGDLVLGANDVVVAATGEIAQYQSNAFEVIQTGGVIYNYGTLNLGEQVMDGSSLDLQSGTVSLTLDGDKYTQLYNYSGATLNLNQGSTLTLKNGKMYNYSTLQIENGATLDIQSSTKTNNTLTNYGTIVVNTGGSFILDHGVVIVDSNHGKKYSLTQAQKFNLADFHKIGKVTLNTDGMIELKNGIFIAHNNVSTMGKLVFNALASPTPQNAPGSIYINNATLILENANLDLNPSKFLDSNIKSSSNNAVLETTGDLTFASSLSDSSSPDVGSLAGLCKAPRSQCNIQAP